MEEEGETEIKKVLIISITILSGVFCNPYKVFSQEILAPKEILIKAISAYGGERALRDQENKNNFTSETYLYSPTGEFFGTYILYFKKPDKMRREFYHVLQDRFVINIYNGGRVFISQNGKEMEGVERVARFRKMAELYIKTGLSSLLYLLDHQDEVNYNYIGEELINGRRCLGLEALIDKDVKIAYFFDSETFLMLKSIGTISFLTISENTTIYYYDFKKVEGINFPFRGEVYRNDGEVWEIRVNKISFAGLDDSLFVFEKKEEKVELSIEDKK